MHITTDILTEDKSWLGEDKKIKSFLTDLAKHVFFETKLSNIFNQEAEIELSVLLTNDVAIKEINKQYRDKDQPTNVLSFPLLSQEDFLEDNFLLKEFIAIGDIVLSFETIKLESSKQNKNFKNHLTHLFIHSILHLVGYDHLNDRDAKIMEDLEIELLKNLEIDNPYYIN